MTVQIGLPRKGEVGYSKSKLDSIKSRWYSLNVNIEIGLEI